MLNMIALKKTHLMLTFAAVMLVGCSKDEKVCSPSTVSGEFKIYKDSLPCSDFDLPMEISFGARFYFDYEVQCGTGCTENAVSFRKSLAYVKHVNGVIDTFHFGITWEGCNDNDNFIPNITLLSEVDNPDPRNYTLGDTIVFRLAGASLVQVDKDGKIKKNGEEILLSIPDYTYEYVLTAADFDCD